MPIRSLIAYPIWMTFCLFCSACAPSMNLPGDDAFPAEQNVTTATQGPSDAAVTDKNLGASAPNTPQNEDIPNVESSSITSERYDLNEDGDLNIFDVLLVINVLFYGPDNDWGPVNCHDTVYHPADYNQDENISVSDVIIWVQCFFYDECPNADYVAQCGCNEGFIPNPTEDECIECGGDCGGGCDNDADCDGVPTGDDCNDNDNLNVGYCAPCVGSFTIDGTDTQDDLDGVSQCSSIEGDLLIYALVDFTHFSNIESITGSLTIDPCPWGCWGADPVPLTGFDALTFIGGDLRIENASPITHIEGMASLSTVTGSVLLYENGGLEHLGDPALGTGLSSLTTIGSALDFYGNTDLAHIEALSNLTSVHDLYLDWNAELDTVDGLSGLTTIPGNLYFNGMYDLVDTQGFLNLTSIGGHLTGHNQMDGLKNLTSIGGDLICQFSCGSLANWSQLHTIEGSFTVQFTQVPSGLDGLTSLTHVGSVYFIYAPNLTNLNFLSNVTNPMTSLRIENADLLTNLDGVANVPSAGWVRLKYNDSLCQSLAEHVSVNLGDTTLDGIYGNNGDCSAYDGDLDGVMADLDCDDFDDANTSSTDTDGDCDGAEEADDCNDDSPFVGAMATDEDCDGSLTWDDCNDNDNTSTVIANDNDCDGVVTANDCNDNNNAQADDCDNDGVSIADDCNDYDNTITDMCTHCSGSFYVNNWPMDTLDEELEAFHYCSTIGGSVDISLDGMGSLDDFSAFEYVQAIYGILDIGYTHGFEDLTGLEYIAHLGGLRLEGNWDLERLDGLSPALTVIDGDLYIESNSELVDITGLSMIQQVNGNVRIKYNNNLCLSDVDALLSGMTISGTINTYGNDDDC